MFVREDEKAVTLSIGLWGPFRSGKTTSLKRIEAAMTRSSFTCDDEPFVPSIVAAEARRRNEGAIAILARGQWTTPRFTEMRGYAIDVSFVDWDGFPDEGDREPLRLGELDMVAPAAFDAFIFVASSAAEDLDANLASLAELESRNLGERIAFQLNKQDVPGALPSDALAAALAIGNRPRVTSIARRDPGPLQAFKEAMRLAIEILSRG